MKNPAISSRNWLTLAATGILVVMLTILRAYFDNDLFGIAAWAVVIFFAGLLVAYLAMRTWDSHHRALASFIAILFILAICVDYASYSVRAMVRWRLQSHTLKTAIMASDSPDGTLKHAEMEATGFAGIANNTTYAVYDPTNELTKFAGDGNKIIPPGLPCRVWHIQRVERDWYSVLFYTDTRWTDCPKH